MGIVHICQFSKAHAIIFSELFSIYVIEGNVDTVVIRFAILKALSY